MTRSYVSSPTYPLFGCSEVLAGWDAVGALAPARGVLAVDGPVILDWEAVVGGLARAQACVVSWVDLRHSLAPWGEILARTAPVERLRDDPDFATVPRLSLADLFDALPAVPPHDEGLTVVFGPGSALVPHDVLWNVDLPKRYAEIRVAAGKGRNLGAPDGERPTTRRLFYVDWPLLDRHRSEIAGRVDLWVDLRDPDAPTAVEGPALRVSVDRLVRSPFRTRPTFNTSSWGGHWGQRELGVNPTEANTAIGYELIAPESGILLGPNPERAVEIPFEVVVDLCPDELLGPVVRQMFGGCFPIRFDYLDTVDGGNLSVHCHPGDTYMREVFGVGLAQHETYYVMVGSPESVVFLGLAEGVDVDEFRADAGRADHQGEPFDITRFVQQFPATEHQLYMIPAGTPHGSGRGNVILEISATPYLYSLRFYDWLRRDSRGRLRPVHVAHAFSNLDLDRTGNCVQDELAPVPCPLASGAGWREDLLGRLPEMFFEVRRVEIEEGVRVTQDTGDRFHVLNVVAGERIVVRSKSAEHVLNFAETMVVPAAVGEYELIAIGEGPTRVVKALVS